MSHNKTNRKNLFFLLHLFN